MYAVTSVAWIQRGIAKSRPDKTEVNEGKLKKWIQSSKGDVEDHKGNDSTEDSDDDDECSAGMAGLSFYASNADDPYISKDDPETDEDEVPIDATDNVIALGRVRGDEFGLEAWVYNEAKKTIYCHHDYILSECPLAVEYVGFGEGSNLVAVGTMGPDIELWDLNFMNTIDPAILLKGVKTKASHAKKKMKKTDVNGHTDAVLGLSWNKLQQQVLASASADSTVGVWDLEQSSCVLIKSLHSDKVQAVQWHPFENQLLLSGSFDHYAKVVDCRSPEGGQKSFELSGEVEKVLWNHYNPCTFLASTDTGHIYCYDIRAEDPLFHLEAHTSAVTGIALSPLIDGCLATSSADQSVKVWDVRSSEPKLVIQKKCKIGSLFCVSACPESELLLCVGGEREMRVLDMKKDDSIVASFLGGADLQPEMSAKGDSTVDDSLLAKTAEKLPGKAKKKTLAKKSSVLTHRKKFKQTKPKK